jgi:hypothetical protein
MATCPECGFRLKALDHDGPNAGTPLAWHYDESGSADAGSHIRGLVGEAANILRLLEPDQLRLRPAPGVWSRLEYACHIRDVLLVQRERVLMVRRGFEGEALPMGRDERVSMTATTISNRRTSPCSSSIRLFSSTACSVGSRPETGAGRSCTGSLSGFGGACVGWRSTPSMRWLTTSPTSARRAPSQSRDRC